MSSAIKVDLWFWHLDEPTARIARWRRHLDRDEQARIARFMFVRDQTRFTICRSRMRRILGWYTHTNPSDVRFDTTGRNKPVLADIHKHGINFNLTHTEGLACLAVTTDMPVGVDLERIRDIKDDFIVYALNPPEQAQVLSLGQAERQPAFFRFWTAKEAYLKSIGTGLWQSLKTFDVVVPLESSPGDYASGHLPRIDDTAQRIRNWHLYTLRATHHHIGALALAPPAEASLDIRTRWIGTASKHKR